MSYDLTISLKKLMGINVIVKEKWYNYNKVENGRRYYMLEKDLLELLDIGENSELECKAAEMQLPKNIWETYSSFANTNGGTILLGVEEVEKRLVVKGADVVKLQREFWDNINNRQKVSLNILQNRDVFPVKLQGKSL